MISFSDPQGRERRALRREGASVSYKGRVEKAAESVPCLKSCFGTSQLFHKGFLFSSEEMPSGREVKCSWCGAAVAGSQGVGGGRTPRGSVRISWVQSIPEGVPGDGKRSQQDGGNALWGKA